MNARFYTTAEVAEVSGITLQHYKQMVRRGQMALSAPRVGTGRTQPHTAGDVLQAAFLAHLARLGIGPRRASMIWAMAAVPNLDRDAMILLAPRPDDSDLDVRVMLPGGDDGLDRPDAPAAFAAVNLGLLQSRIAARLDAMAECAA